MSYKTTQDARPAQVDHHWLIERRLRVYPRILLVMFVLAVPAYALTFQNGLDPRGRPVGTDFIAFWSAARVTIADNAVDPWNLAELAGYQRTLFPGLAGPTAWVYPPTMLLLVLPLGYLGFTAAFVAWTVFGLAAFLGTLSFVVRGYRHAWPLILAFPGLWLGIAHGQTQFVVAALMGGALLLLGRNPVLAGVLIGLMAVKPHLAILFPVVLIAGGQWRAFGAAAVTAIGAFAAGVLTFGTGSIGDWLDGMGLVGAAIDADALPVYKFVTPYTTFRLLGVPELTALTLHMTVAVPVVLLTWKLWRKTSDVRVRGAAVVVATFLVTPYAADYDLVVLAFPIAWMALTGLQHGWLRGDRNLLVLAWVLPWMTAPIAVLTHLGITPIILCLLLRQLWLRSGVTTPEHRGAALQGPGGT